VVLALWSALLVLLKIKLWPFVAKNFVLITCIAVVLVAPWTYRNYRESHTFVLVSTGMGEVMLGSYNDRTLYGDQSFRGDWMPPLGSKIHDEVGYTSANDKRQAARALAWIRAHLGSMPYLLSLHFLHVWKPYSYSYGLPMEEYPTRLSSRIVQHLIPLMTYAVYLLAFLGLVGTWKRWKKELIGVYLAIALTTLTSVVAYGTSRFRSPIEPFLVLLAGGALWCCTRCMHKYLPANLWAMLPFFKQKSLEWRQRRTCKEFEPLPEPVKSLACSYRVSQTLFSILRHPASGPPLVDNVELPQAETLGQLNIINSASAIVLRQA